MKVFMTGATGYIGEHLALKLAAESNEIVALVRSPEKAQNLVAAGVTCVTGDLNSRNVIDKAMVGCEAVFHLAAYARVWPEDDKIFQEINVQGTRNILELAQKNNVRKVVITSTAGVYGPSGAAPVHEKTIRAVPYYTPYEATKALAEDVARAYANTGLHVVIVNPARVYGPGRSTESNAVSQLIRLYLAGILRFIPGSGNSTGSYCFINDVVDGHIKALEYGRSGESYLFGGENISYDTFFQLLQQVTHKHQKLIHIPVPLLVKASKAMVFWARLTTTKPLITPAWVKKYMYNWSVSSQKAVSELGYNITPFDKGLKLTIENL